MRRFEFVVALALTGFGVRSAVYWARRPFESTATRDQLLYADYLTGRVGMWFAFAGLFYLFAFAAASDPAPDPTTGALAVDDPSKYAWYLIVFAVLGALQLLAGWFLGHGGGADEVDGQDQRPGLTP